MDVREAADDDWEAIWPFFREIVAAEETYVYDPEISEPDARDLWMIGPPGATFVAVDDGAVVGSANAYANRPGPGKHVASASFMVDLAHTGKGIGRALGERVIEWATETGFRGLVFNAVVERTRPRSRCGSRSGWRSSARCPRPSAFPTARSPGCTSCTCASSTDRAEPADSDAGLST